jgi:hypothetical protein
MGQKKAKLSQNVTGVPRVGVDRLGGSKIPQGFHRAIRPLVSSAPSSRVTPDHIAYLMPKNT